MVYVVGYAARPQLSDSASDAEAGRIFAPFTANAGTYQRTDSTITFTPVVAKVPAVMSGKPFTLHARVKADTLEIIGGPIGGTDRATWIRIERRQ
jgi:hypothetical protein